MYARMHVGTHVCRLIHGMLTSASALVLLLAGLAVCGVDTKFST